MKLFKRSRKLGNKGFSLVELVCAMAILAVLGTAISGVMLVSINSYRNGNNEVNVQEEIQLVCNQISDFLIDSTAEVTFTGSTLTIKQGANTYTIQRKADNKVYFQENAGEEQIMAENVESFNVDVSDFSETGNVKVEMKVAKSGRSSVSNYTVTARNKEVKVNSTNTASITVPSEVVLVPGENRILSPTVSGLVNNTIHWEVFNNTSSDTKIVGNTITVGLDEMAPMVKAHGVSAETVNGSAAAECWINIYVRRVNTITVTGNCITPEIIGKAGAKYVINVDSYGGSNLDKDDPDLSVVRDNPFDEAVFTFGLIGGVNSSDYSYTISGNQCVLTLNRKLSPSERIIVKATAKHPNRYNRAGSYYGDVSGEYEMSGIRSPLWDVPEGDGWQRQSDSHQAQLVDAVLRDLIHTHGAQDNSWKYFLRYVPMKDETTMDGSWSDWIAAGAGNGGDANGSMHLNLRPGLTSMFKYNKLYKLEIIVRLYDASGNEVWPLNDPDEIEIATYSSLMMPVTVAFDCKIAGQEFTNQKSNSYSNKIVVRRQSNSFNLIEAVQDSVTGVPGERLMNQIRWKVQKKNGSTWDDYDSFNVQAGANAVMSNLQNYPVGDYRLKVWATAMPERALIGGNLSDANNVDWVLYDESIGNNSDEQGTGIFYFSLTD